MTAPFDIFRDAERPMWLETADSLESAKARILTLGEKSPGVFLILDQRTGQKIQIAVPDPASHSASA